MAKGATIRGPFFIIYFWRLFDALTIGQDLAVFGDFQVGTHGVFTFARNGKHAHHHSRAHGVAFGH